MVWAEIGRPNQREWLPDKKFDFAGDDGLYPSGYYLFDAEPDETLRASIEQNEKTQDGPFGPCRDTSGFQPRKQPDYGDRLWKGWVLPASDGDTWFVAGSAEYHRCFNQKTLTKP